MKFSDFSLHPKLLQAVEKMGYQSPTPVQEKAIPLVLTGRDAMVSAQTGTGKTASFLLPLFHRLLQKNGSRSRILILEPTRELALQIADHGQKLSQGTGFALTLLYGGTPLRGQVQQLKRKPQIVVATPGRLLDHIQRKTIRLQEFDTLVVDEADRMLDMGFLPSVLQIVRELPPARQTLLFSATLSKTVQGFARRITKDPVSIRTDTAGTIPQQIEHTIYPVSYGKKMQLLLQLFRRNHIASALIFCGTKRWADLVAKFLQQNHLPAEVIHGDRSQSQRELALRKFRDQRAKILVASDVASRGLDIEAVSHVINFDAPKTPDAYIQRVGRTAHRPDASGRAITFVTHYDLSFVWATEKVLGYPLQRDRLEGFQDAEAPHSLTARAGSPEKRSTPFPFPASKKRSQRR